ncbi:MAG TPA: zinc ribbon domain-containing protein [Pyrinomonadaceae bacterium]|nr:zinc ribbon domain-containing protein [Pyrinomonadaceae bacterium]
MFCPQCGQQQVSDAARFCSRCGFQLAAVAGLLTTGGRGPAEVSPLFEAVPAPPSPKRKGAQLGGKFMLFGVFLIPVLAMLSEIIGIPEEFALLGLIAFTAGLFRLLYALLFEDGPYRRHLQRQPAYVPQPQFAPPQTVSALPPPQSQPARPYVPPRPDTAELSYRPSVTEGTTKLLERERDEQTR